MKQYQYIGGDYTMVRLEDGAEKVKVVDGEIIESDREETYFTKNNFVLLGETDNGEEATEEIASEPIEVTTVENGEEAITVEVVHTTKKSKK